MALSTPLVLMGAPVDCPDLLYATGFMAPDPVVYIQFGRQKYLIVSSLEYGRAVQTCQHRGIQVRTPTHLGLQGPNRGKYESWIASLLNQHEFTSFRVPEGFPYGLALKLQNRGFKPIVMEGAPFAKRRVKKDHEIKSIRQSQEAAVIAMRAAIAMLTEARVDEDQTLVYQREILTCEIVRRKISEVLLRHDCYCGETIVASGTQAADPHERGTGPIRAGEAVVIDIFPRHQQHGYWGDITRSFVKGKPSPQLKKMYETVLAAQKAAFAQIRPGASTRKVHQAAVNAIARRGFKTERDEKGGFSGFIHSTGHGVGLAIHEAPSLGNARLRLRAGDVVTVEPGLYYPAIGGIRIEDTIVVTDKGWQYLAPCEKNFTIA